MNAKAKGTRNEHKTRVWLEERGWRCCRSAASLGVFDIVGFSRRGSLGVQVKSNHIAAPAERKALEEFECADNMMKLLFTWIDRVDSPRIHLLINNDPPSVKNQWSTPHPFWMELETQVQKESLRAGPV